MPGPEPEDGWIGSCRHVCDRCGHQDPTPRRSCIWGLRLYGPCLDIFNRVKNYYRVIEEDNFKNNFTLLNNVIFEIMIPK